MKTATMQNLTSQPVPAALTASRIVLRGLIGLNWVYATAILAGLIGSLTAEKIVMTAIGVPPSPETQPLIQGMRAMALLGLDSIPMHYVILKRLLDIVESVRARDPFVGQNASRLQTIAWALMGLQVLSVIIGGIAKAVSTPAHPFRVNAGFSTNGWLAVLLLFVLARVFAEGARMRDELEGTV
ncbi:MAG: DUF2975 domain-containing protein [Chthoniobacterales bacterium]